MLLNGRYDIQETLGEGGMGIVYRAHDRLENVPVAVKQLKPEMLAEDPDVLTRFMREGEALRQLNHPGIVHLQAMVQQELHYYLIMDYVTGGDLQTLLKQQGSLSIARLLQIALDIADALTRAHRLNIIHRDLKPANVLIAADGTPRLSDFGVAQIGSSHRLTNTDAMIGTLDYLAPEVLRGESLDVRADIWAFGVMLYEMLIGERPFKGDLPAQVVTAILMQRLPDLEQLRPDAPLALVDLIYRMLAKDPSQRTGSVRRVGLELETVLRDVVGSSTVDLLATLPEPVRFQTTPSSKLLQRHNLPAQITPFVGRDDELQELTACIADDRIRLMTILAPGGMGKTRLALELARQHLDQFEHGVYFVELAPVGSLDDRMVATLKYFIHLLKNGYSILQVLEMTAEYATEPTAGAIRQVVDDIHAGSSALDALVRSRSRLQSRYIGRLVDVIKVQMREGGNLAQRLDDLVTAFKAESPGAFWSEDLMNYETTAIVSAIASATGYQFQKDGRDDTRQLLEYLRSRTMLLVLDNFEHLLAGSEIVTDILKHAPGVQIVVTSRQRLNQSGEMVYQLSGMTFPEWETPADALQYSAVQLFMQSARRVRPDFDLTAENMHTVARICRLVQGMPLGIVLAAAWLEMLSPDEIAVEISQSLDFLTTEARDVPERHRSMRAVFDYSWNLMTESEQHIFQQLSVFRGGFNRDAALIVTGTSLRALMSLMNRSLIRRDPDSGRYAIHELLRQYAREKLYQSGEHDRVRGAHSACYASLLHQLEKSLYSHGQIDALKVIERDYDNITEAWGWAVEKHETDLLHQALDAIYLFHHIRTRLQEGITLLRRLDVSATSGLQPALRGRVLLRLGRLLFEMRDTDGSKAALFEALEILQQTDQRRETARCLLELARTISQDSTTAPENVRARDLTEQAYTLFQEVGDDLDIADTLFFKGYLAAIKEDDNAYTYTQQSLELARRTGDRSRIASALTNLAAFHLAQGEIDHAEELTHEALRMRRELDTRSGILFSLGALRSYAGFRGEWHLARTYLEEALSLAHDINRIEDIVELMHQLAFVDVIEGKWHEARQRLQHVMDNHEDMIVESLMAWCLAAMGDHERARPFIRVMLTGESHTFAPSRVSAVQTVAFQLCYTDEPERSVEMLAAILQTPWVTPVIKETVLFRRWRETIAQQIDEDTFEAAWQRGVLLDVDDIYEQLRAEYAADSETA